MRCHSCAFFQTSVVYFVWEGPFPCYLCISRYFGSYDRSDSSLRCCATICFVTLVPVFSKPLMCRPYFIGNVLSYDICNLRYFGSYMVTNVFSYDICNLRFWLLHGNDSSLKGSATIGFVIPVPYFQNQGCIL